MWKPTIIKCGRRGDWSIEPFSVTAEEATQYKLNSKRRDSKLVAGHYVRLIERGMVWMSNTPDEYEDHREFIRDARGRVLVVGLGMGLVIRELLDKKTVDCVTVVEKEFDVISMVAPALMKKYGARFNLVCCDLWSWWPAPHTYGRFDCAWIDVWPDYSVDMMSEFRRARNHIGKICAAVHVKCWKEKELKGLK